MKVGSIVFLFNRLFCSGSYVDFSGGNYSRNSTFFFKCFFSDDSVCQRTRISTQNCESLKI